MRLIHFLLAACACLSLAKTVHADWAGDKLSLMTVDEKVGQLFICGVYPSQVSADLEGRAGESRSYEDFLVHDLHIGGILLKHGWMASQQIARVEELQRLAGDLPLLVAQDLERGAGSRVIDGLSFPKNMTLGAIENESLLYRMGAVIGMQARELGVNLVLAPVVDINSNPENPVIHMRSFGEDRDRVTRKGLAVMRGLQDAGVLSCAKHFPGHGDTQCDSHETLPHVSLSRERLHTVELHPFRQLIRAGVSSVLTAHLAIPVFDPSLTPASLSKPMVTGLLREDYGFDGLIITDDLLMGAIQRHYGSGVACKLAVLAGSDLILTTNGIAEGIQCIKEALQIGELTESELDSRVLRILHAKRKVTSQTTKQRVESAEELQRELFCEALTLLGDPSVLPRSSAEMGQFAQLRIAGISSETDLEIPGDPKGIIAYFSPSDSCIRAGFLASAPGSDEELTSCWAWSHALYSYCKERSLPFIAVWFGSPYGLRGLAKADAIIVAYEDVPSTQAAVLRSLKGDVLFKGILPVTIPSMPHVDSTSSLEATSDRCSTQYFQLKVLPNHVSLFPQPEYKDVECILQV